ncbi:MAG: glycosyltransferase [Eubacteriales bacterium]
MKNSCFHAEGTKTRATLSVCLIVRDEERVLGRVLSAAVRFADELIVVDTGSKDKSKEIAREYTDLVFSEPWTDSFARARNSAASKAKCDFVMWLDADDVMYDEDIRKLVELKKQLTPGTDVVFTAYRNYGFLTDMGLRDRIHRRELACLTEGDVHEAIPIDSSWNLMFCPEITIFHKKEYVNDPERNMRIFDNVRNVGNLTDAFGLSYYCRELAQRDAADRALAAWQQLLDMKPAAGRVQYALVFLAAMLIRRKEYEKCRQMIGAAVERYGVPLSAFLCYHLGLAAEGLGETAEAERQYRRAAGIPVNPGSLMIEFNGYDNYLSCLKLCALAYDRGDKEESETWNNRAGSAWPEGRAWRINRERFFTPPLAPGREPLVSVIMPAYNAEAYIGEAVSSILDQSWQNLELIIVDDASTDSTADVVRGFSDPRIRLLTNSHNLGVAASTNRAVQAAGGEYLALMDDDDLSLPDRLKAQVTFLENNREIMILGTGSYLIDPEGKCFGSIGAFPESPEYYRAKLLIGNLEFCNSSAMIRKTFPVENSLPYREGYFGMQDYRFYMEASKRGNISCLADMLHRYRVHDGGMSVRARRDFPAERARMYNRIRCDSLRMSGVRLSEREEAVLGRLLPEGELPVWNRQEREQLSGIFAEIKKQLTENGFTALRELDGILWSVLNH